MSTTTTPEVRLHIYREQPEISRAMDALQRAVDDAGIDPALADLIRLRASQINGCGYCIDMHAKDARRRGDTEQRIYGLTAWREAPYYTERERAAFALTEAVTLIPGGVPDEVFEEASRHFEASELAALIWAIGLINAWNRVAIPSRDPIPGSYEPHG
jgi:AhpD family alkylhydroperoxidase